MTVSNTQARKTFAGNGSTTSFATTPIVFFDDSDLVVLAVTDSTGAQEELVLDADYSVSGGDGAVGTVDTSGGSSPYGAPASGVTLVIKRRIPATQAADLVNNDNSDAEVLEAALDKLTLALQDRDDDFDRALRQPEGDTDDIDRLPAAAERASRYLAFDADGDPVATAGTENAFVVSAFAETLLDDANAAAMRTTLGVPSSAEAVLDTLIDAKGDLIVGTAADTPGVLTVGANGSIPMARSGAAAGLAYAAALNKCIYGWTYAPGDGAGGGDLTNDITITAGGGMDGTNAYFIAGAASTKRLDAAWAVGSGNGGLDTGAVGGTTGYYIWAIARSDTGVVDYLFSLSATSPTMPANYDFKRLIGWFYWLSGSTIRRFMTYEREGGGIHHVWYTGIPVTTYTNAITTSRTLYGGSGSATQGGCPAAFTTEVEVGVVAADASNGLILLQCPDEIDSAASATDAMATLHHFSSGHGVWQGFVRTNASGQIAIRANVATVDSVYVTTRSYRWSRR